MKLLLNITFTKPVSLSTHSVIHLKQKDGEAHGHSDLCVCLGVLLEAGKEYTVFIA